MAKRVVLVAILVALGWLWRRGGDHSASPSRPVAASVAADRNAIAAIVMARLGIDAHTTSPTIDGHVVDTANVPLAGVKLCAMTATPVTPCTISDARGAFTLRDLVAADLRSTWVMASLPHYSAVSVHDAESSTAQHTDTTVTMKPGAVVITGVVRDTGGGPIAHAIVTGDLSIAETDHDGTYTLWAAAAQIPLSATADGISTHTV